MGDLPESRDWGGGGGRRGRMGDCERERLITVLKLKTWWGGGEGLPRVEGCSMDALSNLNFFCLGWSASSW